MGTADRGSFAQRNADGSGGKHIRRRGTGKLSAERNVNAAAGSFSSMVVGIRSIAAMTATSKQGSGRMCKVDKFYTRDGRDILLDNFGLWR